MDIKIGSRIHNRFDIEVRDKDTGELKQKGQSENIYFTNLPFHNALLNYLLGGSSPSNYIELGRSWNKGLNSTDSLVLSKNSTCTANNIDKKVIYNVRFGIDEGNTYISEIGLRDTFTCKLPNVEVFTQHNVVDKQLGIGDGVKDTFVVPDRRIKNLVIKVDNVIVNNYSHTREISINYNIGYFTDIKFSEISKSGIVASKISTDKSQLAIYSIDGEIAYQMSTLDIEDNGNIRAVCFNSDGEYVALYKNIQPALLMYKRQNDNYIKLPEIIDQPTTLTTNNPNSNYGKPSITFSYNDMYLALGLPFDITIVIYKRNGDEFIERTDISDFLTSSRSNLSFIQDKLLKTDEGCYNVEKTRSLIKFDTPPPEGAVITANYTVPYIPKTEDYVLDVTCEIQFGEGA